MVVHVLFHGFALCQFDLHVPREWPAGHRWVDVFDAEKLATCEPCKKKAKEFPSLDRQQEGLFRFFGLL
jgi:hypothetical protein